MSSKRLQTERMLLSCSYRRKLLLTVVSKNKKLRNEIKKHLLLDSCFFPVISNVAARSLF